MFKYLIAACLVASSEAVTIKSDPICNSAGCTQYLHPKKDDFKKNYFVPDFGRDNEINQNFNSLKIAENQLEHKWDFPVGKYTNKKVVKYNFNTPLDEDVVVTKKNLKDSESVLGHKWEVKEVFKD